MSMGPSRHLKKKIKIFITECLRRAGETPDRTPIEEVNDDKFSQLLRNKNVYLFSLFLMIYVGVEVTIGGIMFVLNIFVPSLIIVNQDGL